MRDIARQLAVLLSDLLAPGRQVTMSDLDRSIAAAASAHREARRALAVAVAEETRETERCRVMALRVVDLEERAVAAIRAGREDLALAASEAIAAIRTEREASEQASTRFAAEAAAARGEVNGQRRRLAALDRGRRLAAVGRALNSTAPETGADHFTEAEDVLARVNADNANSRAVRLEMAPPAERTAELLANEGFGRPLAVQPTDVMARLREMAAAPVLIGADPQS
jgi:hypothetical protein